jgi:DNA-binding transcriptional MerR regulator
MFRIGYFSRISGVPIETLRFYDRVGLLKPAQTDPFTGYRYYTLEQLRRLNRILVLKDLGLSLEQVARILQNGVSSEEVRGMLRLARLELEDKIQEMRERSARVAQRLRQLELEDKMKEQDIVVKAIEPLRVISARHSSNEFWLDIFKRLHEKVASTAARHQAKVTGPLMGVFYEDPEDPNVDCDFEVALPTDDAIPGTAEVQIRTLPAIASMATTLHYGAFDEIYPVYDMVIQWIYDNGYTISGPYRSIYHQWSPDGNPADFVTEIQFPIARARDE